MGCFFNFFCEGEIIHISEFYIEIFLLIGRCL